MSTITARAAEMLSQIKPLPPQQDADQFLRTHGIRLSPMQVWGVLAIARVLQNQDVPIGFVNLQSVTDARQLGEERI